MAIASPIDMPSNLGGRIVKSSAWSVGTQLTMQLMGLVSTLILARVLVPADFGLIALASLVVALIEMLSLFSFDVWIIRHRNPDPDHYNTVWTLSVIRGLLNASAIFLLAPLASSYFDEPRLFSILAVLSIAIVLEAFQNVGVVDFRKHLAFDREFLLTAGSKLSAFVVTVVLAVVTHSYWAMVSGIVVSKVVKLALSYRMHPFRPRFTLRHWREVFAFAKWLLVGNLIGFLYKRSDTFILGKLSDMSSLGVYNVAFEIVELISTAVVMPIRQVLLPGYSKMRGDLSLLRRGFLDGLGVILLIGIPAAAGIGLVASPLVRTALGDQWLDAIPLIQVLSVYSMVSVAFANQGPCLIALGRVRLVSTMVGLGLLVLVPAFIWGTLNYGIIGGAVALGVTNSGLFLASLLVTLRVLELPFKSACLQAWRTVVATGVMALTLTWFQSVPGVQALWPPMLLISCILAGVMIYVGSIFVLWRLSGTPDGPERTVVNFLVSRFRASTTIME